MGNYSAPTTGQNLDKIYTRLKTLQPIVHVSGVPASTEVHAYESGGLVQRSAIADYNGECDLILFMGDSTSVYPGHYGSWLVWYDDFGNIISETIDVDAYKLYQVDFT